MVTYEDLIEEVCGYLGKDVSASATSAARRAAQGAIRELQSHHDWTYYRTVGRLTTVASYNTGTVSYDHTGGANERQLTLTGGTWPSWIADGYVAISDVAYEVSERISNTIITLTSETNPGDDIAGGTSYTAGKDTYLLPTEFEAMGNLVIGSDCAPLDFIDHQDIVVARRTSPGIGRPTMFSIIGSRSASGRLAAKFWPTPDAVYQIDYDYRRRPSVCRIDSIRDGLATTTIDSTTVTGHNTSWSSRMVGSVFRVSFDAKTGPTGLGGLNPAAFEALITAVGSATSLTLDAASTVALSRCKYVISDPVDVEPGAMETALYRLAQKHVRQTTRMAPIAGEVTEHERALQVARTADARYYGERGISMPRYGRSIRRMPTGTSDSITY